MVEGRRGPINDDRQGDDRETRQRYGQRHFLGGGQPEDGWETWTTAMPKQMVTNYLRSDRIEAEVGSRTDSLSNALKNEGEKPRWTAQDAYILIHKCVLPMTGPRSRSRIVSQGRLIRRSSRLRNRLENVPRPGLEPLEPSPPPTSLDNHEKEHQGS